MFLLKQDIFFLFFVIGANARMDPQLLSDIARIFLSHFNDANPNYILSYLPKKGIYVNIENILPTVISTELSLHNDEPSIIEYKNLKIQFTFSMTLYFDNFSKSAIQIQRNNIMGYLNYDFLSLLSQNGVAKFNYSQTPKFNNYFTFYIGEFEHFDVLSELFENNYEMLREEFQNSFLKQLDYILSQYPTSSIHGIFNFIINRMTSYDKIMTESCKDEGVEIVTISKASYEFYEKLSEDSGRILNVKVNAGYQTPKSYKLVNLKLSSIVIEKERINLYFEEGMDEIGKKLLIEVINGIFQKQKN